MSGDGASGEDGLQRWALTMTLVAIALAAIALPGWAVARYWLHPPIAAVRALPPLDAKLLGRFQAMADGACRCTRKHGGESALAGCWAGYDKETAPYKIGTLATMCEDDSPPQDCFGEDCTLTVTVNRLPAGLCSDEERRIAAAIWSGVPEGPPDAQRQRAYDRAKVAYERAYDDFVHGRKVAMPKTRKGAEAGCGG